jgi:hypothetical protein
MVAVVMSRNETSFRVDSPHKDPSCLGMTTAGEREKLIMFEIESGIV